MYKFVQITVHISICFFMHNFVRMTIHIIFCFWHAHLCTNEYPYYYRYSSCTSMYELLSIFFWVFVMHIFVQMTTHIILGFVMHIFVRVTIHISMGFVRHIFVQMTIHILTGPRHAHLCTNDYFVLNFFPFQLL